MNLAEEVAEIVGAFERERRDERQPIRVLLDAGADVVVEAAGGQLRQIAWNLLRNAAESMPAGGTVTISIARELESTDAGRWRPLVVLTVTDTGSGIPRSDLDRIFEPFFSTKSGGTGLGLPTVARIVDDHHGTIEIGSEVGRGTTVTIRLPAARNISHGALENAA